MNIIQRKPSYVVGISTITTNADEMRGPPYAKIGALWQRFMDEGVADRIPNRAEPGVAVLYTDLVSDESGPYRIVIGALTTNLENVPNGMTGHAVPAGPYARRSSRRGPVEEVVIEAWQAVWNDSKLKMKRSYAGDLEIYGAEAQNPANAVVDLWIGLKD